MRKNQISIRIERFGDQVPDNYPKKSQVIHVYADSNNIFEALALAYSEAVDKIKESETKPSLCCCESSDNTNPLNEGR